jgi:hypothetical protein
LRAAAYMAILPDREAATQHEQYGQQGDNYWTCCWIPHPAELNTAIVSRRRE